MTYSDPLSSLLGSWSEGGVWAIFFRFVLAVVISSVIGCERSTKRHSAGLRTFNVAALAGTVAALLDAGLIGYPVLSAGTAIGMAIIGCNSILFSSRNQIKGLTTSFALWACGLLGMACGAGFYTVALAGFAALELCLLVFPVLELWLKNRSNHFEVLLELAERPNLKDFIATIRKLGLRVDDIEYNPAYANSGLSVYTVSITILSAELKKYKSHAEIIEALKSIEYVNHIEELP